VPYGSGAPSVQADAARLTRRVPRLGSPHSVGAVDADRPRAVQPVGVILLRRYSQPSRRESKHCARAPLLGDECLSNGGGRPPVRAVDRGNLLRVQTCGDLLQRHPLPEHRVDPHTPSVVTLVAAQMRQPNIVPSEVPSMRLEPWVAVGRRRPIGKRRSRIEVPTTAEAVALGHLAAHVDELAVLGKLPEDPANSEALKFLNALSAVIGHARKFRAPRKDGASVAKAVATSPGTALARDGSPAGAGFYRLPGLDSNQQPSG